MNAPKILPWIAKKAGISETLALKLWRRAAGEAAELTGQHDNSEYWGQAVARFLSLVEDEVGKVPSYTLTPAPRMAWFFHHQHRISLLSLIAAQNTYRLWQENWYQFYPLNKAA